MFNALQELINHLITKKKDINPFVKMYIQNNQGNLNPEELDQLAIISHATFKELKNHKINKSFDDQKAKGLELKKIVDNELNESINKIVNLEDKLATILYQDISTNQNSITDYMKPQCEAHNSFNKTHKICQENNISLSSLEKLTEHFNCVTYETNELYYKKRYKTTSIKRGFLYDFFIIYEELIPAYKEAIIAFKKTTDLSKELDELDKEFSKEQNDILQKIIDEIYKHIQYIEPGLICIETMEDNHGKIIDKALNSALEAIS